MKKQLKLQEGLFLIKKKKSPLAVGVMLSRSLSPTQLVGLVSASREDLLNPVQSIQAIILRVLLEFSGCSITQKLFLN